jgi:CRISPR-associated protein Cas5d
MTHGITLKISGDYALFSRPEMKVERVSYDVITPSAARGILEAIYWKPQMRWEVTEIRVLKPIRFTNVRRNEISSKIPMGGFQGVKAAMQDPAVRPSIDVAEHRQQRASLLLKDVAYVIRARVHVLDRRMEHGQEPVAEPEAAGKHLEMFKRRARKGQAFHQPYFGCREFPVRFELIEEEAQIPACDPSLLGEKDLGFMLHEIDFDQDRATKAVRSATPHFFRAQMIDGVISVPPLPFSLSS